MPSPSPSDHGAKPQAAADAAADPTQTDAGAPPGSRSAQGADLSALAPLSEPVFRMLWLAWLAANICMWMNDVAAAWVMTTLTSSPMLVALVQTASTLPVFLLGLPSGALADILDRRRYFMATQFWVAAVAVVLCLVMAFGSIHAWGLLALIFANGIGLAMRWPVFSAIVPELVNRHQLPAALALNGVAMNVSRIIGPLLAGAIIASVGSVWVFVLNAVLSVVAGAIIMRWRRVPTPHPLGRERLGSAMRVGLQFVRESRPMRAVMWRIGVFFLHGTALLALLPLVARDLRGGNAGTFTLLLACMGAGAVVSALFLPRLRQSMSKEALVVRGTLAQALATSVVAMASDLVLAVPAMLLAGGALLTTANTLMVSAQLALPNWVRARGMAIAQMAMMGATAAGAALWGQVASLSTVQLSLALAGLSAVLVMALIQRQVPDEQADADLSPAQPAFKRPQTDTPPSTGQRLVVSTEYFIDPAHADEFRALMQESRRARMGQGALGWSLQHDLADPRRYVERVVDESWTEHLRRFDRLTGADLELRVRKHAFHTGAQPPIITRYAVEEE